MPGPKAVPGGWASDGTHGATCSPPTSPPTSPPLVAVPDEQDGRLSEEGLNLLGNATPTLDGRRV
ncbi:hypothetical protein GCM10010129_77030 [Streptomyces fumigatiscleroticus]|nr:hypothetical protein GCM10010129_77030 [Streptomyces fumigatiscleroticus]